MSDPQIWTMIGAFTALMLGVLTLMSTMFVRVLRSEIGGLRSEMRAELGGLRAEMNARFEAVDARFNTIDVRMDGIDRDVQALVKRTFGLDRE